LTVRPAEFGSEASSGDLAQVKIGPRPDANLTQLDDVREMVAMVVGTGLRLKWSS
jgi:hypothetical protein